MDEKHRIAISDLALEMVEISDNILSECELLVGDFSDSKWLLKIMRNADAIIFDSSNDINSNFMKAAPNLKIAFKSGAWPENVDFDYAKKNGIAVGWTPGANAQSVAEYTILLILAAQRKFLLAVDTIKQGGWRGGEHIGFELYNKTIGIVGAGAIGLKVASMFQGFNGKVLVYDPYQDDNALKEKGITSVNYNELLEESDIISIHCLLTEETRQMFNKAAFEKMKTNAILINTARGGLINEFDLIQALRNGDIRGAALDVFSEEPPSLESDLRKLDNIILTPHVSAFSKESAYRETMWALQGAIDYLSNKKTHNVKIILPNK